ncbi:MAG: hypothetical protein NTZ32_20245 [Planctomycetales bacterium]|nr:hypothetical protein [Planctomycetales bacterium]
MFRSCVAIMFLSLLGCGRQTATPVAPPADHSSHGGQSTPTGNHAGHPGMAEMAAPAKFVMDAGGDNLKPGVSTNLVFHLERDGKTLSEFELLHERVMHFIVVRDALDEFQHLHPTVTDYGLASVEIAFPTAGTYWLFVDCQAKGEAQQTVRHELRLAGDAPAAPELKANVPVVVTVGETKSEVSVQRGEGEWLVTYAHRDLDDKSVTDLEPYLGAMGHLVVIGAGTGEYVHAHAETQSAPDGRVKFAAHIARPGIYKAWGQFQRQGQVFTVPAVLQVD